jgi:hypothetical protein
VRRRLAILKPLYAAITAVILLQCVASLGMAVNHGWHETAHHDANEDDHDCPVVQLAHGFWDAPSVPLLAVPHRALPPVALTFPDTARLVPALILSASVLEHAPPVGR